MGTNNRLRSYLVLGLTWVGCGAGAESEPVSAANQSSGHEQRLEKLGELQVEGLKGTLSQEEIGGALEPRMLRFANCPSQSTDLEFLSGELGLHFVVGADGTVTNVYPTHSTLGDRSTEACMLKVARSTRFPLPHGGTEAEFDWSLEIPADPNVREPVDWGTDQVRELLSELGPKALDTCGFGGYRVTAYVDTDGAVLGVGATRSEPEATANEEPAALDCIAETIGRWKFTSPGSYPAKVSFDLR